MLTHPSEGPGLADCGKLGHKFQTSRTSVPFNPFALACRPNPQSSEIAAPLSHQVEEGLADQREGGPLADHGFYVGDQAEPLGQEAPHAVDGDPPGGVGDGQISVYRPDRIMKATPSI